MPTPDTSHAHTSAVDVRESSWSKPARIILWALPIGVGVWLRSVGLRGQVLVGDERWEVLAALERSVPELFQNFLVSGANYSPPLAAVHRVLIQSGFEPSELALRAPVWICGVLLLVGIPLALRRVLPFSTNYLLCWLLAISPQLVFYSRMIRGYVPLVLLGAIATWAALRCIETGSRRAGVVYALSSGLAVCMHLLTLPFVLAPLAYAGVRLWLKPGRDGLTPRGWLGLGLAVGVAILLFVGPAWRSIFWLLEQLGGEGRPGATGLLATLARLAGVGSTGWGLVFWGVAALGVWRLFSLAPRLAGLGLTQLLIQVVAVSLIGSLGSESEVLLTRFVMVVLPLLLLFTASGLAPSVQGGVLLRAGSTLLAGAFLLFFYLSGPLVQPGFREGSFVHEWAHRSWNDYEVRSIDLGDESFYSYLQAPGRSGPVIETLWHGVAFPDLAPAHQRVHRQPVRVASLIDSWWSDPRLSLRNSIGIPGLPPQAFLESDGRWVVVHLDPQKETMQVRGAETSRQSRYQERHVRELARRQELLCRRLAEKLEKAWGKPDYRDRWVVAWDLDRIRSEP